MILIWSCLFPLKSQFLLHWLPVTPSFILYQMRKWMYLSPYSGQNLLRSLQNIWEEMFLKIVANSKLPFFTLPPIRKQNVLVDCFMNTSCWLSLSWSHCECCQSVGKWIVRMVAVILGWLLFNFFFVLIFAVFEFMSRISVSGTEISVKWIKLSQFSYNLRSVKTHFR